MRGGVGLSAPRAVQVGSRRYYRPIDAVRVLRWTDTRRVRRHFDAVTDPDVVASVISGAPTPGRPPGWVVDADEVDGLARAQAEPSRSFEGASERPSSGYHTGSTHAPPDAEDTLRTLRSRLAELEGAYGGALEHRERLLDEIEALHRLGITQVASQRALLDEMRSLAIPSIPDR